MKRFINVLISVVLLAGLIGCSDSSDEIAELRAEVDAVATELDATKAELDKFKLNTASETPRNGLEMSFEEVTDFFNTCSYGIDIDYFHYCDYLFRDVMTLIKMVPDDEQCREQILIYGILSSFNRDRLLGLYETRHFSGFDYEFLSFVPACVDLERKIRTGYFNKEAES